MTKEAAMKFQFHRSLLRIKVHSIHEASTRITDRPKAPQYEQ